MIKYESRNKFVAVEEIHVEEIQKEEEGKEKESRRQKEQERNGDKCLDILTRNGDQGIDGMVV